MGIFKSYDIRGLSPQEINEDNVTLIGAATARYLKAKKLVVGWDMRPDSPGLRDAFIKGANSEGASCIDVGMVTTPLVSWAVKHLDSDGSVMITASHNPAGYNGLKINAAGPVALSYETGLNEIEKLVESGEITIADTQTSNEEIDLWPEYKKHLYSFSKNWKPFKIVVDAANGMGGLAFEKVFDEFPGEIIPLYFEPDGNFPNHEANPLKAECIKDLQDKVIEVEANFGVALDGDGDRCAFVDEKGLFVPCDLVTAVFAPYYLSQEPGGGVIYDLRSSHVVPEIVAELGGKSYRERVGHSHMKKTLRDTFSIFGGELSGHYYFRDHANSDSGLMAFVVMMNIMSATDKTMSEVLEPLHKYAQSGEINFNIEDKDGMIKSLEQRFSDGKSDHLDGLTVEYDDWWFNVRKSNTEPMLRLNLEAQSEELCQEKLAELKQILNG